MFEAQKREKSIHAQPITNELIDILNDFENDVEMTETMRERYYYNPYVQILGYLKELSPNGIKAKNIDFIGQSPVAYLLILEKNELVIRDKDLRRWYIAKRGKQLCKYLDK